MPSEQNIHKLETPESLYVNRFWTGLITNRSPLFTPISPLGLQIIQRQDVLWDGSNVMLTPHYTVKRRYGHTKLCTQSFGASEWPLTMFTFEDLSGTLHKLVDTQTNIYSYTGSALTSIYSKAANAGQSSFVEVANTLYWCDGKNAKKWDGTTVTNMGIATPTVAPTAVNAAITPPQPAWAASTFYNPSLCLVDNNSPAHIQKLTTAGTTGNSIPTFNNSGGTTTDGTAVWTDQGGAAWQSTHAYSLNSIVAASVTVSGTRTVIINGKPYIFPYSYTYYSFFQVTTAGTSAGSAPTWSAAAGTTVNDGTVVWINIGQQVYWSSGPAGTVNVGANTAVVLTEQINDSNNNLQNVYTPGKSGAAHPTWATTAGVITSESGSLSWSCGGVNQIAAAGTAPQMYVYCYKNSTTGQPSTASAASASLTLAANSQVVVQGQFSADSQVDTVEIYRTKQGGGVYYFLADITNTVGTGTWTYYDGIPDANLNTLIIAPTADSNDPPPPGISILVWYAGRLWAIKGNTIYYSGGPDTTNGVGEECWPPANNFAVLGNVTAAVPTSGGLVLFTADDAYLITGTTAATFTAPILWQQNWGVQGVNSVTQDGDNVFIFTSKGQVFNFNGGNGSMSQPGDAIADKLAAMTPGSIYLTLHRSGQDEGLFLSDGSTNLWRFSLVTEAWDTPYAVAGGIKAIASVETSTANWNLAVGRATGAGYLLFRDVTTYADDGSNYSGFATFGSITVAPPRQTMEMHSVLIQAAAVGSYPTVSVILNEITDIGNFPATFVALPNPVPDPPKLPQSLSLWTKRHDLKSAQAPLPQLVQHLQMKVSFATENAASELLGFGIA